MVISRAQPSRPAHRLRRGFCVVVVCVAMTLTAGCGIRIPSDPRGSLDRIEGGALRVGASIAADLVEEDPDGTLSGSEVAIVEAFAAESDATIEWTVGSEETLVTMLEDGDLDIVVGGMTDETPWTDRAGVTRGYPEIDGADGRALVLLVPLGENRLLSTLEAFLDREVGS